MSKLRRAAIFAGVAAGTYGVWRTATRIATDRRNAGLPPGRRILILGAGFGGANVARRLARLLPREPDAEILLIDRRNYLLFTPMLPEVAGGELDPLDIVRSLRAISPRVQFLEGDVESVDLTNKRVTVRSGGASRIIAAEYIVIAVGAVSNLHHVPGVQEYALTIKSLEDAQVVRTRAIQMLEQANAEPDRRRRQALLTFTVAGGGLTGVETMAALNSFVREAAREYRTFHPREITTYLFEDGRRLLPELAQPLADYARRELEKRGVIIHTGVRLASAGEDFVELEGNRRIPAATLIWAAGVKPAPVVEKLGCHHGPHGGIVVDRCCAVVDHQNVWAIGDCAEIPKPNGGGTYSPTAQNATREGIAAAENVAAVMRGRPQRPFRHRTIGEMALVGRHSGVAQIYNLQFSGLHAWMLWRFVYLSKMPGWGQRARILSDWTLDLIFGRQTAAIPPQTPDLRAAGPRAAEEHPSGVA